MTKRLIPDLVAFPDGIKAVADYVHSMDMKLGIYTDRGIWTCQKRPGSKGHEVCIPTSPPCPSHTLLVSLPSSAPLHLSLPLCLSCSIRVTKSLLGHSPSTKSTLSSFLFFTL